MEENPSHIRSDDSSNAPSDDRAAGVQNDRANGRWQTIAVSATAIALLAIAIPFVWSPGEEAATAESSSAAITPASSHAPATDGCMANAKPAQWDFTLKDLEGRPVSLASFRDPNKVVLLNFWATWCGPCKAEIPGFIELQEQYKDQLTIIGYSVDDTAELAKKYAEQYQMNYPIVLGEGKEEVQDAYGPIWGIPASFIISKDGLVCRKHMGIAPKAVFEKEIVALLN